MSLIEVQKISNGELPSGGRVYIGVIGSSEPESNPVQIYFDYEFTEPVDLFITSSGIPLDLDGFTLIQGQRTNLYSKVNYSFMIRDHSGARFWKDARHNTAPEGVPFDPESDQDITGDWSFSKLIEIPLPGPVMEQDENGIFFIVHEQIGNDMNVTLGAIPGQRFWGVSLYDGGVAELRYPLLFDHNSVAYFDFNVNFNGKLNVNGKSLNILDESGELAKDGALHIYRDSPVSPPDGDTLFKKYNNAGTNNWISLNIQEADGRVLVHADPVDPLGIATKQFVEASEFDPTADYELTGEIFVNIDSSEKFLVSDRSDLQFAEVIFSVDFVDGPAGHSVYAATSEANTPNGSAGLFQVHSDTTILNNGSTVTMRTDRVDTLSETNLIELREDGNGTSGIEISSSGDIEILSEGNISLSSDGDITVNKDPETALGVATKSYVDANSGASIFWGSINPLPATLSISSDNFSTMAPLGGDLIALVGRNDRTLQAYSYTGVTFAVEGLEFTFGGVGSLGGSSMGPKRMAIHSENTLRTYDYDGISAWSLTGSAFSVSANVFAMTTLTDELIVMVDGTNSPNTLRVFSFTSNTWSAVGPDFDLPISSNGWSIVGLSSTRIALASLQDPMIVMMEWNGATWAVIGSIEATSPISQLVALNDTDVLVVSGSDVSAYRHDGSVFSKVGPTTDIVNIYSVCSFNGNDFIIYNTNTNVLSLHNAAFSAKQSHSDALLGYT